MRWPCLTVLPGCFQIRGNSLKIDDQWRFDFCTETALIDALSKLLLRGTDPGKQYDGIGCFHQCL